MFVPRIRIEETDDICVLICYLIYSLGCPLSKQQLIEITSYEEAVNYFSLIQALEKAKEHLCEEIEVDGEPVYTNTPNGISAARNLGKDLPATIRDKTFKEAVRVYTRDMMKRKGSQLAIRYIKNADGTCTVGITIMDDDAARHKYYIELTADNSDIADGMKQKIKSDPKAFTQYIDKYFK